MATHHIPAAASDNNQSLLGHPMSSALAWTSRAGVLLNPDPVFGTNQTRFEHMRAATYQDQQLQSIDSVTGINSEMESTTSADSYLPLPGARKVPPTLIPVHRSEVPRFGDDDDAPVPDLISPAQRTDLQGTREITTPFAPVQRSDTDGVEEQHEPNFDQMEHYQAKEQSRLLERFKLLKQWQQQQQEKMIKQQQEQLLLLRSEQQRVHQAMLVQRQKQWGTGQVVKSPPRKSTSQSSPKGSTSQSPNRQIPTSPHHLSRANRVGMSNLPQAVGNGSMLLSQRAGPQVLNPLLTNGNQHQQFEHLPQEVDLDTTASETNSSIAEDGVYPLSETLSEYDSQHGDDEEHYHGNDHRIQDDDGIRSRNMEDEHTEEFTSEEDEHTLEPDSNPTRHQSPPMNRSSPSHQSYPRHQSPPQHQSPPRSSTLPQKHRQDPQGEDETMGDDRPIRSGLSGGTKTFEQLIEEQLRMDQQNKHSSAQSMLQDEPAASPGRKFLRRGQGIARYGKVGRVRLSKKQSAITVKPDTKGKKTVHGDGGSTISRDVREQVKPKDRKQAKQENPQPLSRKVAVRQSVPNHPRLPHSSGKSQPLSRSVIDKEKLPSVTMGTQHDQYLPTDGAHPDDTIEMSFQVKMQEWTKKAENEVGELEEFELLEEAADNTSFSSNASLVVNMMTRHTANKQVPLGSLSEKSHSLQSSQEQPYRSPEKPQDQSSYSSSESDESDLDRTLKGDTSKTSVPSNLQIGNNPVFSPILSGRGTKMGSSTEEDSDFGAGKTTHHEANSSGNNVQRFKRINANNSRSEHVALDDPNSKHDRHDESEDESEDGEDDEHTNLSDKEEDGEEEEDEESGGFKRLATTSSHALNVDFEDEESWGDLGNASDGDEEETDDDDDESIVAGLPGMTSTPPVARAKGAKSLPLDRRKADAASEENHPAAYESPPTSKLVSKLFPKLKPVVPKQQLQQEKQQEEAIQKAVERPMGDGVQSKLLRDKLSELENEIERFRKENTMLAKLRDEREKSLASLQKEINEFQKQKAEELQKLQEFKDEEMKKLRREKKNFEKYQKAMRTMPDKKDRSEIEVLKNQLSDLQDELNKRESRWQSNSARLRTRVEMLEKENKELGDEVGDLQEEKRQITKKDEAKVKSNAAKVRARQLAELESARLASFPALPRVNVNSSSSDDETGDSLSAQANSKDSMKDTRTIHKKNNDGDIKSHHQVKQKHIGEEEKDSFISPPRAGRVVEANHTRKPSEEQDDPSSQPRVQRKRSVHFDANSPKRSSPVHTATQPSSPAHQSPTPKWNLDHPAVSHGSSPAWRFDQNSSISSSSGKKADQDDEMEEGDQIHHSDGKVEHIAPDGSRIISFRNGTRKEISSDGQSIIVTFFNGDMKQIMTDGRVVYYYSETGTSHTTYPDGLEILQFPNNQTEKHYPDGTKEITFPDQTIKYLFANGNEESVFADGTVLRLDKNGDKTMEFPNGQREVHTKQYKKREYPDGSVKTVYLDGRQETRYSNGRIRVKDKDGTILVDKTC